MDKTNTDNQLCACGCGQPVNRGRKYVHGHNNRGRVSPRKILPDGDPPLCACGCGERVLWSPSRRRWNRRVKGHERRGIPQTDAVKDALREKALSRSEQIAENNRRRVWTDDSRRKASEAKLRNLPAHHFRAGELNPQYKHGQEYQRPSSSILLRRRAEIINARGFRCELCGDVPEESALLHMHHVDDNPFNNALDNLQLLCVRCHNRITHPI